MSKQAVRPTGMSQLDYLWTHFGGYSVSSSDDSVLVTELVVKDLIKDIHAISYLDLQGNNLNGLDKDGNIITTATFPEEIHPIDFKVRLVTQEDINNGCLFEKGSNVLSLLLNNQLEFLVNLDSFGITIKVESTSTIDTTFKDGIISSDVRISEGLNKLSAIEIKSSVNGLYANLKIEDTPSIELDTSNGSLKAKVVLKGTTKEVAFQLVTLELYLSDKNKSSSTLYFITDRPFIYLDGVKYGNFIDDAALLSRIEFDEENSRLVIYRHSVHDPEYLSLGNADAEHNGLMSKDTYNLLINSLAGITGSIKEYVDSKVDNITMTEDYVEGSISKNIIFKNGEITNAIQVDVLNWINA